VLPVASRAQAIKSHWLNGVSDSELYPRDIVDADVPGILDGGAQDFGFILERDDEADLMAPWIRTPLRQAAFPHV
jgi:hypothetical protein